MESRGFTLYELIITLGIICITVAIAIPSLDKQVRQSRTETATLTLLNAIETSRSTAVFNNTRTMLLATNKKWHDGWVLFIDLDDDGKLDSEDTVVLKEERLKGVFISAKAPANEYVSFIGTGEGRKIGKRNGGALLMGTIKICPERKGIGYSLVLSRGGRTRVSKLTVEDCTTERN